MVSNIDHTKSRVQFYDSVPTPRRFCRAVLVYSFTIRSGDGGDWEPLGCTDLLNDDAALAFGNDVIRDMLRDNVDQYPGWSMDIAESGRAVCSIAFALLAQNRRTRVKNQSRRAG